MSNRPNLLQKLQRSPFLLLALWLASGAAVCQTQDTFRVVFYNLLNFPGNTPTRADTLVRVLNHVQPEVFIATEVVGQNGYNLLLTNVLNQLDGTWAGTPFVDGPDSDQIVYYRSDLFGYKAHATIATALRDIYHAQLYVRSPLLAQGADTVFLNLFSCHLKASSGSANEALRAAEAQNLRDYLDAHTNGTHIIVGGDYNWSGSSEAAYVILSSTGNFDLLDPLNRPGTWNNNSAFADIHTQSPRTTQFGGGANGGMDDRFDMMLVTNDLLNTSPSLRYVPGSYWTVGNDGLHFNLSILDPPTNTSAPYTVLSAIHNMSDHLPIALDLAYSQPAVGWAQGHSLNMPMLRAQSISGQLTVWYSGVGTMPFSLSISTLTGQQLAAATLQPATDSGQLTLGSGEYAPGVYLVTLTQNGVRVTQKVFLN